LDSTNERHPLKNPLNEQANIFSPPAEHLLADASFHAQNIDYQILASSRSAFKNLQAGSKKGPFWERQISGNPAPPAN
jgi:hypothetical protein